MITTVSLNPAIDKTIMSTDLKWGEVNRIESTRNDIGGKGINVAKILNRLNIQTKVCGYIGNQNKQIVEELLSHEELNCQFFEADGLTRTNTKIVELGKGITTELNEQGFFLTKEQMKQFQVMLQNEAGHSDFVVFSGSIPRGLAKETYQELISIVCPYTKTVLDAEGPLLVEGIKAGPYMIKPNIQELEEAFHIKLESDEDIISFCRSLADKFGIHLILVSMGEKGSLLISGKECYKAEPIKVEVKSTVGAGDSMIAGMLYGINKGFTIKDSFKFAAACGTLAVTKEGTMSLAIGEIQEMLKRIRIINLYEYPY